MQLRNLAQRLSSVTVFVLLALAFQAPVGTASPALQADCGYTPEDDGTTHDDTDTLDKCLTTTFDAGGTTKRIVVFYTDTGGPVFDADGNEDGAGANTCNDGVDNGGDATADADDPDCLIDHRVSAADATAILDASVEAWQVFVGQGFRDPKHDGGQGADDGSADDKDNRLDVWIEHDSGDGWWGVAWWPPTDHFSVHAPLAALVASANPLDRRATVYHELWHRVQYSYDLDELMGDYPANAWLMEGTAREMSDEVNFDVDNDPVGRFVGDANIYLGAPQSDLRGWSYKAGLWWKYFAEQAGDERDSDPGLGVDVIVTLMDETLNSDGFATLEQAVQAESPFPVEQLFQRFTLGNYTKDFDSADTRYAYIDDDAAGLNPVLREAITAGNLVSRPADPADSIVQDPWAARYFEIDPDIFCPAFHYTFTGIGADPTPVGFDVVLVGGNAIQEHVSRRGTSYATTFVNDGYTNAVGVVTTFNDSATYRVTFGCATPVIQEIERPRSSGAGPVALAGPSDRPRPFTVRLRVGDDSGGATLAGLRPTDFSVRVNGQPAFVSASAYVLDRYWLTVIPPLQAADGLYDLSVELVGIAGSQVTAPSAVQYTDVPQNDVIHVFDVSDSMEGVKLDAAKQAFKLLVNELAVGDYGGLVRFAGDNSEPKWEPGGAWTVNNDAAPVFELREIDSVATRDALRDSVDPLAVDGWTSIGDGLLSAVRQYQTRGVSDHPCTVILMSDGAENEGTLYVDDPLNPDLVAGELERLGCRVDAIAFGDGTDEALMQRIADDHGGDYYYAPDDGESVPVASAPNDVQSATALPPIAWQNELARTFDHAITRAVRRQRIRTFTGNLDSPTAAQFEVGDADHLLVLALKWLVPLAPGDDVRMRIFDPDGAELRPAGRGCAALDYPATERYCAETNEVVRIGNPKAGRWEIQFAIAKSGGDYVLLGNVQSDLTLELLVGAPTVVFTAGTTIPAGHRVPLVALLTSPKGPVAGADVEAAVQHPDGTLTTVRLHDDGAHGDGDADDGFYANTFFQAVEADLPAGFDRDPWDEGKEPEVRGSYKVTATALVDGLRREAQASFAISPDTDADADGISDTWEDYFDPTWAATPNANADDDLDGLTTLEEYENGTHPLLSDTDGGGESDGSEIAHDQNPLDPADDTTTSLLDFNLRPGNAVVYIAFNMRDHNVYRVWRRTVAGGGGGPVNTIATPDSAGTVGGYSSLALDAAGNPVVSYLGNGNLRLLHCGDPTCTSGNSVVTVDNSANSVGWYSSVALNSSGNPVIGYYDGTAKDVKVARCTNPNCSARTIATPDSSGDVGQFLSLALDSSDRPVLSYYDATNGDLKILRCGNTTCTSGNSAVRIPTASSDGLFTSLVLDSSSNPSVIYQDLTSGDLRFRKCSMADCSDQTAGSFRALDVTGHTGEYGSLQLDAAGNPVVSFKDGSHHLRLVHCNEPNCATYVGNPVDTTSGFTGLYTSLRVDAAGNPVIAYQDAVSGHLRVAHCGDPSCSSVFLVSADATGFTGLYPSLALDAAGIPIVSYQYNSGADLKLLHCGNADCAADASLWHVVAQGSAPPNSRVAVENAAENDVEYAYRVQGIVTSAAAALTNTFDLQAADTHAGGLSGRLSTMPKYDPVPPIGLVEINDGARSTLSRAVSLQLAASDTDHYEEGGLSPHAPRSHTPGAGGPPAEMRIRNDAHFPADEDADWVPYAATVGRWDLAGAPGVAAHVYVQFRDAAGNISTPESDAIIYCQPDRNSDGQIGPSDLDAFAADWATHSGSPGYDPMSDMDGDMDVDTVDLTLAALRLGQTCD